MKKAAIFAVGLLSIVSFASAQFGTPSAARDTAQASSGGECVDLTRDLNVGSSGSEVSLLQSFLNDPDRYLLDPIDRTFLYLPSNSATGYFGSGTRQAVTNFQRQFSIRQYRTVSGQRIIVYGVVFQETRDMIRSLTCDDNASTDNGDNQGTSQYRLTVSKSGNGSGTVIGTISNANGVVPTNTSPSINCGSTCSATFSDYVRLEATPASGSTFAGWSGGGCSGTASTCTVTMSSAKTVTATFNSSSGGSAPTASLKWKDVDSGVESNDATDVDPTKNRRWVWTSSGGTRATAAYEISDAPGGNCSDEQVSDLWLPWNSPGSSGTSLNGQSSSVRPGSARYGCKIDATYTVTNASGQSTTANASVTFRNSPSSAGNTTLAAPTNFTATAVSATSIRLTWNAPSSANIIGYKIWRGANAETLLTQDGTELVSSRTFTDTGLSANTSYRYTIKAYTSSWDLSSPVSVSATTLTSGNTGAPTITMVKSDGAPNWTMYAGRTVTVTGTNLNGAVITPASTPNAPISLGALGDLTTRVSNYTYASDGTWMKFNLPTDALTIAGSECSGTNLSGCQYSSFTVIKNGVLSNRVSNSVMLRPAPSGQSISGAPTAKIWWEEKNNASVTSDNANLSLSNVDPTKERYWKWSSTGGASAVASAVVTDNDQGGNCTTKETVSNWEPWGNTVSATGNSLNGSVLGTPGTRRYGCKIVATYRVTNTAGQSVESRTTINFRNSATSANQRLTVTKIGTGSGTVSETVTTGDITCGNVCSATYAQGATVTLTAYPASGSTFAGWSGACTNTTGTCTVTMDAAKTVTATFNTTSASAPTYTLTVNKTGTGSLGSFYINPPADTCYSTTCTKSYAPGTSVTVAAWAMPGSTASWSGGGCDSTSGTNPPVCTVTMNSPKTVTVSLSGTTPQYRLGVTKAGNGSGTVTSSVDAVRYPNYSSPHINCGTLCSTEYLSSMQVTLTATPAQGSSLYSWSGPCQINGANCVTTMDQAKNITVTFNTTGSVSTHTLTINKTGSGTITSVSNPTQTAQINCGSTCSASYGNGATVTLYSQAGTGASFTGWSGDSGSCGTATSCVVTMNSAKNITATFTGGGNTNNLPPNGSLDRAVCSNGSLHVGGWAADPDYYPIPVHIYVDGTLAKDVLASLPRSDLTTMGIGPRAYDVTISQSSMPRLFTSGNHSLAVYAINMTSSGGYLGSNPGIGTRTYSCDSGGGTTNPTFTFANTGVYQIANGYVFSTPAGISCGGGRNQCSGSFANGTQVTFTAVPDSGYALASGSWGSLCAGSNATCSFTVNNNGTSLYPTFTQSSGNQTLAFSQSQATLNRSSNPAENQVIATFVLSNGNTLRTSGNLEYCYGTSHTNYSCSWSEFPRTWSSSFDAEWSIDGNNLVWRPKYTSANLGGTANIGVRITLRSKTNTSNSATASFSVEGAASSGGSTSGYTWRYGGTIVPSPSPNGCTMSITVGSSCSPNQMCIMPQSNVIIGSEGPGYYYCLNTSSMNDSANALALQPANTVTLSTPVTIASTEEIINFTGLKRGANEVRVAYLKEILRTISPDVSRGCMNLSTTNTLYGPTTESCVKVFQNLNELEPTGIVNEATNRALNAVIAR